MPPAPAPSLGTAPSGVGRDTPRSANIKINGNFDELYAALGGAGSSVALPAALPVANGGTGTTTTAAAPFPSKAASGINTITAPDAAGYDTPGNGQGGGLYKIGGGWSSSGLTYAAMIRVPYAAAYEAQIFFPMGMTTNKMFFRCALGKPNNSQPLSGLFLAWRKVMTATEKDRDILARTLWGEARGEGLAGQIAVAWTIRNRVNEGRAKSWWGEGYAGVC